MFVFNEGSLAIPASWKDESINVLSPQGSSTLGFSFVINRDELPWGITFAEYTEQEVGKVGEALEDYKELMRKDYILSNNPAHIIEYQWKSQQGLLHQVVIMTALNNKILIFTASAPNKMSDNQKKQFQNIVTSFKASESFMSNTGE